MEDECHDDHKHESRKQQCCNKMYKQEGEFNLAYMLYDLPQRLELILNKIKR